MQISRNYIVNQRRRNKRDIGKYVISNKIKKYYNSRSVQLLVCVYDFNFTYKKRLLTIIKLLFF